MVKIEYTGKVSASGEPIGSRTKATVVKNQVAPPFQVAEFDIAWGIGIDRVASTLEAAIDSGVVSKSGAFLYLGDAPKKGATAVEKKKCGTMLGQGKASVIELMREDESVMNEIEMAMMEAGPGKRATKRANRKKKAS
jgi:recombination protein RecA